VSGRVEENIEGKIKEIKTDKKSGIVEENGT
jgi:hypothetical protein